MEPGGTLARGIAGPVPRAAGGVLAGPLPTPSNLPGGLLARKLVRRAVDLEADDGPHGGEGATEDGTGLKPSREAAGEDGRDRQRISR